MSKMLTPDLAALLGRIDTRLGRIEASLARITDRQMTDARREIDMNEELERIRAEVEQNADVTQSAVTLLGSLSQQIRDAAGDEEALAELADNLDAQNEALAAAITANTPFTPSGQ